MSDGMTQANRMRQKESWVSGEMAMNEPVGQSESPITEQEKAVIEAVGALEKEVARQAKSNSTYPGVIIPGAEYDVLIAAYRALSQPQPVSPDRLRPGDKFRFTESGPGYNDQKIYEAVVVDPGGLGHPSLRHGFYDAEGKSARCFDSWQRVIPLEQD